MIQRTHTIPRWLIGKSTGISDARIFVVHTQRPRFIGELVPEEEEAEISGITIAAPFGEIVCRIEWIDDPVFDAEELCWSLAEALRHHDVIRGAS